MYEWHPICGALSPTGPSRFGNLCQICSRTARSRLGSLKLSHEILPNDKIREPLEALGFQFCSTNGKKPVIWAPGAKELEGQEGLDLQKGVHYFLTMEEVRVYVRSNAILKVGHPERVLTRCRQDTSLKDIRSQDRLSVRLWGATSEEPLPTFQATTTEVVDEPSTCSPRSKAKKRRSTDGPQDTQNSSNGNDGPRKLARPSRSDPGEVTEEGLDKKKKSEWKTNEGATAMNIERSKKDTPPSMNSFSDSDDNTKSTTESSSVLPDSVESNDADSLIRCNDEQQQPGMVVGQQESNHREEPNINQEGQGQNEQQQVQGEEQGNSINGENTETGPRTEQAHSAEQQLHWGGIRQADRSLRSQYRLLRVDIHMQREIRNANRKEIGLDPILEAPFPSTPPSDADIERVLYKMSRVLDNVRFEIQLLWEQTPVHSD